ncbi:uncharacterized protein [Diadema setosum]|uniref:uncharacterized protein isoform X2 n=1 Tax=Diadema setosum TaxID=31175 RepID=UPI003B3AB101
MHFFISDVTLLLLTLTLLASSEACTRNTNSTTEIRENPYHRLRRSEQMEEGQTGLKRENATVTMVTEDSGDDFLSTLDLDDDDWSSVSNWSIEGGLLRKLWELLGGNDQTDDNLISWTELETAPSVDGNST